MSTILVTGIDPFDGESINPSWEAARALEGERFGDAIVKARQLPCVIAKVNKALEVLIEELNPSLVICLGQASGRANISLERVAINIIDARIPDNEGKQPVDEPVVAEGPVAYFSTLPIKAIARALKRDGIPVSISQTAGTYNCNAIFYGLAHYIATRRPTMRGGFVHVPYLPEMAVRHPGAASMALSTLISGVRTIVRTSLDVEVDIKEGGGATH
jgi:pyroglutamyl-peptidase